MPGFFFVKSLSRAHTTWPSPHRPVAGGHQVPNAAIYKFLKLGLICANNRPQLSFHPPRTRL